MLGPYVTYLNRAGTLKSELWMQCWDWKSLCDLIISTQLDFEDKVMNAVLGLKESVCDLSQHIWALKTKLWMQCWDWKSLYVTYLTQQGLNAELWMQCWVCVWLNYLNHNWALKAELYECSAGTERVFMWLISTQLDFEKAAELWLQCWDWKR